MIRMNNVNINTRDGMGRTPLHNASSAGDCELVELLINNKATIDSLDSDNDTPLHVASSSGHLVVVKLLVQHGANVHSKNRDYYTPLHKASEKGYHDIAEYLLESGANANDSNDCYTALRLAAGKGHEKVVKVLLKHGADVNVTEKDQTPLAFAAESGHDAVVSLLLQNNADVDPVGDYNETPLCAAARRGHMRVVEILLDFGASINRECMIEAEFEAEFSNTALDVAAEWERRDIVAFLLKRGAKIANSLTTSLHHSGNPEICEDLIKAGADVNAQDANGSRCLHRASTPESVNYLISQGANVHAKNNLGMSPLHMACSYVGPWTGVPIIIAMLEAGLDVNGTDNSGRTPLHASCLHRWYDERVTVLLEWGADIHCQDHKGLTALHMAAWRGYFHIVKPLIENGSDLNIVSNDLRSVIDYAVIGLGEASYYRNSSTSIIAYLERHVMLMRSANMYLRASLFKYVQFKELDQQCQEELGRLKVTYIGNSSISYYKFLGKSIDQIVFTLRDTEIQEALNSGWFKEEFPNFGILIGIHFNKGNVRKQLIDRVFENCSDVFIGLLEECVYEILSFLNNQELAIFADGFSETQK